MSQHGTTNPVYNDGRTKQSFKNETDINAILKRAQKTGTISHLSRHEGRYADFSNFNFAENLVMLTQGREIFDDLLTELRREFNQSPAEFFAYVNDPANVDRLGELLPALAAPGDQNLRVNGNISADETKALEAQEKPLPDPKAKPGPEAAPAAPEAAEPAAPAASTAST